MSSIMILELCLNHCLKNRLLDYREVYTGTKTLDFSFTEAAFLEADILHVWHCCLRGLRMHILHLVWGFSLVQVMVSCWVDLPATGLVVCLKMFCHSTNLSDEWQNYKSSCWQINRASYKSEEESNKTIIQEGVCACFLVWMKTACCFCHYIITNTLTVQSYATVLCAHIRWL